MPQLVAAPVQPVTYTQESRYGLPGRRLWSTLPPVRGYDRIPDDPDGRRMLRCQVDGAEIPSLGVGYHQRGQAHQAALRVKSVTA